MHSSELANLLNGREYREEITKDEEALAKYNGLVVVFGASDDLMEFRGAIHDELGAYDGTTAYLTNQGLLTNDCESDDCPHYAKIKASANTIDAIFDSDGYTWIYKTKIPHSTFEVVEGEDKYGKGIVFLLSDV